jgi:hypothetical protein
MHVAELLETPDLRQQIAALNKRLPARWRDSNGKEVRKNPHLEHWLDKEPDDALPAIITRYEEILSYLQANQKAKLSDPYVKRRSKAELATYQILLQRSGPRFAKWLTELYKDEPAALAKCRASRTCMVDSLEDYLDDQLSIGVRKDGLITFWHLDSLTHQLIGDLPVALFHFTASRALRSIRQTGLEGDRDPVNDRKTEGVYLTTEQSGPAIEGYIHNARHHHGGHGVRLTIKCYLNELGSDEDDADISSGATQFMVPHVPASRIVASEKAWA